MTTQAEDLGKLLGTAIVTAADKHGTAIVAASIHIHTGLSQIAEALGGPSTRQTRQDALGQPRMPGRRGTATEPERGPQDDTQPDPSDAILVQDRDGDHWGRYDNHLVLLGDVAGQKTVLSREQLESGYGPLTVIIDANGNPAEPQWSDVLATAANPAAVRQLIDRAETAEHKLRALTEPDWLDADQLEDLPALTVAIRKDGTEPRWRDETGEWCLLGHNGLHGETSDEFAPALVLWTPEANR